jgi:tetratricopeptide (TPR) repeat protein
MIFVCCRRAIVTATILATGVVCGCQATGPQGAAASQPIRDSESAAQRARAGRLGQEGAAARRAGQTQQARAKLAEAVRSDPGNGRVQHEMGLVCYELGNLREAAGHLNEASRLLRGPVEPCYNLGLVLEAGGKHAAALEAYERGLARRHDHLPTMENLCRVRIRLGRGDSRTLQLVRACLAREGRPEWVSWLNAQAARLERVAAPATAPGASAIGARSAASQPRPDQNHVEPREEVRS